MKKLIDLNEHNRRKSRNDEAEVVLPDVLEAMQGRQRMEVPLKVRNAQENDGAV